MDIKLGDVVSLRKSHPCGSNQWQVVQLGADIRIKCLGCQRYLMVDRFVLERKIKAVVSEGGPASKDEQL